MGGRRRVAALAAALVTVGAALLTGTASAAPTGVLISDSAPLSAPAAPAAAACGRNGPNRDTAVRTASTAVQIHNGSSTGCPVVGAAQRGDRLDYYCYTNVDGGWTFVRDQRTGKIGWVLDRNLPLNPDGASRGSTVYCGF